MHHTRLLKSELWKRFGSQQHSAEWDGNIYGGGKLSQRFWEYFKAIELLDLNENSIVLDIGGGSPATGAGFFADLLSSVARKVVIMDPNISNEAIASGSMEFVRKEGTYEEMKMLLMSRSYITHIVSISVFEHIDPDVREGVVRAINEYFSGGSFVATLEYHAKRCFFDRQLTTKTVSNLFAPLTNYYLDEFVASPTLAENAFDGHSIIRLRRNSPIAPSYIPLWYPIALRFLKV